MTLLRRNTAADFVRDVGARTNGSRVWAAVLNADNTTYSIHLTVRWCNNGQIQQGFLARDHRRFGNG